MSAASGRRSIFITGAASGIGRATADYFAGQGWFVGAYDVNKDGLASLKDDLGGDNGLFSALDVTDRSAVQAAVDQFGAATGDKMDILYNNAGIIADGMFAEQSWTTVMAVLNVNLIGGLSLIHAAIPLLKATPGSLCMSTSSASATFGSPGRAIYSATKHAIKGFTEAISVELSVHGVRAADVLPGIIDTGMMTDELRGILPKEGMWRLMPPRAVAEAVMAAYDGKKLHHYVPEDLFDYDKEATLTPEVVRDRRAAGGLF